MACKCCLFLIGLSHLSQDRGGGATNTSLFLSLNNGWTTITFTECQSAPEKPWDCKIAMCHFRGDKKERAQSIAVNCNSDHTNTDRCTFTLSHIHADTSQLSKSVCLLSSNISRTESTNSVWRCSENFLDFPLSCFSGSTDCDSFLLHSERPVITMPLIQTNTGLCATPAPWSPFTWSSPTCCSARDCRRCCPWMIVWRRYVSYTSYANYINYK